MYMDENLTMSFEEQQKRREEQLRVQQEEDRQRGANVFGKLAAGSLIYAAIYTGCRYRNDAGIAVAFWVLATIGYVHAVFRMFGIRQKGDSIFIMAVMGLLGISTFLTGNEWIICMNYMAIFLLLVALLLHNFGSDKDWDIGKYLVEIAVSVFGAVSCIGKPFTDGRAFFQSKKHKSNGRGRYILLGIGIAVPCVLFLGFLLETADIVFAELVRNIFSAFRFPAKWFEVFLMLFFGFFSSYCGIRFIEEHSGQITVKNLKRGEPLIAITALFLIALLYLVFCGIQIMYLFVGKMELPHGVTYARYARTGFFQLLFVCVLNLMLVLAVKKYFRESRLLDLLLLVISGCTFVMTASSARRMLMYIKAYQLTFLRVSVLVALFAIALLMAGVVAIIVKPDFSFFRYGIVVVSAVYLVFSFSHVDYFIASYNLSHAKPAEAYTGDEAGKRYIGGGTDTGTAVDYSYIYTLSTDAAPAIAAYLGEHPGEKTADYKAGNGYGWLEGYLAENAVAMNDITLRKFNVSHYVAQQLFEE